MDSTRRSSWPTRVRVAGLATVVAVSSAFAIAPSASASRPRASAPHGPIASAPLRTIPPAPNHGTAHAARRLPGPAASGATSPTTGQTAPSPRLAARPPTVDTSFEGVGDGFSGPQGTFAVNSAPPDTNGDVGPNHYVQIVNTGIAVFSKTGTVLYGPVATNTLWSGFGGHCQTDNDGDGSVLYDRAADRWVFTQFANASSTVGPFYECVAVSQTPDPTGAYYRYSFQYANFPDYPKMAVWPDGYYATYNMFNPAGTAFLGAEACAFDRARMLAGLSATQQCFTTTATQTPGGLLPSHLDGTSAPPAGSPNYLVGLGPAASTLTAWKMHVDWTTPASSTLTGPSSLAVNAFNQLCGGGACVPQTGTTTKLDSLADRLMYRLDYRNVAGHESLVVGHAITRTGGGASMRWYELRVNAGALGVFQQGDYGPDTKYRWMGSLAMNGNGDIGMGFSISSGSTHPGLHVTGRLAADAAGTMPQGETAIIDGAGSQNAGLVRWGDYSSTSVDPADDCTFWTTNEYIPANGSFNWHTRIGTFRLPGCGTPPPPPPTPKVSIGDSTVVQPNRGKITARFTVTLTQPQTSAVTVSYATADGTAHAPADYTTKSGTVNIAAGAVQAQVTVAVKGQAGVSTNKAFTVHLSSVTGGTGVTVGRADGVGTILDDTAKADATLSIGDVSVVESDAKTVTARFTVNLAGPQTGPVTVSYLTANGTAIAPGDYMTKTATITIPAGSMQAQVRITINGDTAVEGDELFTAWLTGPSGATNFRPVGVGTILDND